MDVSANPLHRRVLQATTVALSVGVLVVGLADILLTVWRLSNLDPILGNRLGDVITTNILGIISSLAACAFAFVLFKAAGTMSPGRTIDFGSAFLALCAATLLQAVLAFVRIGIADLNIAGGVSAQWTLTIIAGVFGLVAGALWTKGGQQRLIGSSIAAMAAFLLFLGDLIAGGTGTMANFGGRVVHPLAFEPSTLVLIDVGLMCAAGCAILASLPRRVPGYALTLCLCVAGALFAAGLLVRTGDVIRLYDDMGAAFDVDALMGMATLLAGLGSTVFIAGGAGVAVASCLAFLAAMNEMTTTGTAPAPARRNAP